MSSTARTPLSCSHTSVDGASISMPGTISVRPSQAKTRRIGPNSQVATASWCQPWSNTSIPRPSRACSNCHSRLLAWEIPAAAAGGDDLHVHRRPGRRSRPSSIRSRQLHQRREEQVVLEHPERGAGGVAARRACGRHPRGRGRAASAPARGSRRRAPGTRPRRAPGVGTSTSTTSASTVEQRRRARSWSPRRGTRAPSASSRVGVAVAQPDDRDVVALEVGREHQLGDLAEPDDREAERAR